MASRRVLASSVVLLLAGSPVHAACVVDGGGPVVNNSVVVCSDASAGVLAPTATGVSVTVLPGAVVDGGNGRAIELGDGALLDVRAGPDVFHPPRTTIVVGANSAGTIAGAVENYGSSLAAIAAGAGSVVAIHGTVKSVYGEQATYLVYPGATVNTIERVQTADNAGDLGGINIGSVYASAFYNEPTGIVRRGIVYVPYAYGVNDKTVVNRGLVLPDNNGFTFRCLDLSNYEFSNEAGATMQGDVVLVRGLTPNGAHGSNDGTVTGELYLSAPESDSFPPWTLAPTGTDQRFENRGHVASARVQSGRFEQAAGATFSPAGVLQVDGRESRGTNSGQTGRYFGTLALAGAQHTRCLTGLGTLGGVVELAGGATLTIDDTPADACDFPGTIRGTGAIVKRGPGVQRLGTLPLPFGWADTRPPTNYSGGTSIVAGTLAVALPGALGTGAVTFDGADAVLRFDGDGVALANALAFNASAIVDTQGYAGTLSGATSGTAALRKTGAGTLVLSGAKAHTGTTTVDGGVLRLDGALPGAVVAASGGTLAGAAQVGGGATVRAGGTLRPSAGVGAGVTWQGTSLAMEPGATLRLAIDGAARDQVRAASVNLGLAALVLDPGVANAPGTIVRIVDNTGGGAVLDRFAGLPEGAVVVQGDIGWRITYAGGDGNDVALTAIAIPLAPQAVVATPGDRQVSLAFAPPADNGTGTITGYGARCMPGNFTGSASASPVVVDGLSNGVSYDCTVHATNANGPGMESATVTAIPRGPAAAPTQVVASAGVAQFSVAFAAPDDDGGTPVSGYQLLCQPGNLATSGTASPLGFGALVNGQPYACALSAVTAAGAGLAAQFTVTPRTVPDAPTGLVATPYNTQARFDFAAPAFDGGAAITSYTLRCPPGNQNTVTGSGSPLWLTGLANGNTYANCTVRATNVAGTGAVSNTASVIPLAVPSEVRNAFVANLDRAGAIGFDTPTLGTPIIDYTAICTPGAISVTRASAPIVVATLANGTPYECAVTARNNLGSGPPVAVTLRPNDDLFEDSFE